MMEMGEKVCSSGDNWERSYAKKIAFNEWKVDTS